VIPKYFKVKSYVEIVVFSRKLQLKEIKNLVK